MFNKLQPDYAESSKSLTFVTVVMNRLKSFVAFFLKGILCTQQKKRVMEDPNIKCSINFSEPEETEGPFSSLRGKMYLYVVILSEVEM